MNLKYVQNGVVYQESANGLKVIGFADPNDNRHNLFIPGVFHIPAKDGTIRKWHVKEIAKNAFANSEHLLTVTLPNTLSVVGHYAFSGCPKLKEVKCDNSEYSGNMNFLRGAFSKCPKLAKVSLDNPIYWVCNDVFNGCSSLTRFNGKVMDVAKGAFNDCKLESLAFTHRANIHTGSIEYSGVKELIFTEELFTTQAVWAWIKKANVTICCPAHSKLVDLAYEGISIEVV